MEGSIVDLSTSGCFILTDDQVRVGELIRVEIRPPKGGALYMWGEVVYQIAEMGFALRFTGGDDDDMKRLNWLVKANLHEARRNESRAFNTSKSSAG